MTMCVYMCIYAYAFVCDVHVCARMYICVRVCVYREREEQALVGDQNG